MESRLSRMSRRIQYLELWTTNLSRGQQDVESKHKGVPQVIQDVLLRPQVNLIA